MSPKNHSQQGHQQGKRLGVWTCSARSSMLQNAHAARSVRSGFLGSSSLLTSERACSISHAREGCFVLLAITTTVSLEPSRPARSIGLNETVEEDFSQLSRNVGVQLKETNAWLKEFYSPGQFPELCQYINRDPSIIDYNTGSSTLEC